MTKEPVKIVIEGDFWDVQLYMEKLLIWEFRNGLKILDWDQFVYNIASKSEEVESLFKLFCVGYNTNSNNIKKLNINSGIDFEKYISLSGREFSVDGRLSSNIIAHFDNPCAYLNNDSKVF